MMALFAFLAGALVGAIAVLAWGSWYWSRILRQAKPEARPDRPELPPPHGLSARMRN